VELRVVVSSGQTSTHTERRVFSLVNSPVNVTQPTQSDSQLARVHGTAVNQYLLPSRAALSSKPAAAAVD